MSTKKTASSTGAKPRTGAKPPTSLKTGSSPKLAMMEKAIRRNVKGMSDAIESMAPPGSTERVAAGVAAVAGGALIAGATLGAGPAALAGAAGYLAYKGLSGPETKKRGSSPAARKRKT